LCLSLRSQLCNSFLNLFEFLKVVNLLLVLFDSHYILHHLVLKVVLIRIIFVIKVFLFDGDLLWCLFHDATISTALFVGRLDLLLYLLQLLEVLHLCLVEAHRLFETLCPRLLHQVRVTSRILLVIDRLFFLGGRLSLYFIGYLERRRSTASIFWLLDRQRSWWKTCLLGIKLRGLLDCSIWTLLLSCRGFSVE
jgi:hypothetical protein